MDKLKIIVLCVLLFWWLNEYILGFCLIIGTINVIVKMLFDTRGDMK